MKPIIKVATNEETSACKGEIGHLEQEFVPSICKRIAADRHRIFHRTLRHVVIKLEASTADDPTIVIVLIIEVIVFIDKKAAQSRARPQTMNHGLPLGFDNKAFATQTSALPRVLQSARAFFCFARRSALLYCVDTSACQ
jgi:hypothetical protein